MSAIKEFAITEWNNIGINFWNVSKCAGTSVKYALLKKADLADQIKNIEKDKTVHNNSFIKYITRDQALYNDNQNVAVVRHPVDRVVSLYRDFSLKRKIAIPVVGRKVDISKIDNLDYFINFYIKEGSNKDNLHLRSISWSLCNGSKILVDKIYKFENIDRLFKDYNLDFTFRNKSAEADIKLTKEQVKIIEDRYNDDYNNFGFKK